jgi:2,3-dihydroxybenzoate decarboxylase
MDNLLGRRGFFGKTAALAVPMMLRGNSKMEYASSAQSSASGKPKVKRIAIEEHWTSEDVRLAIKRPKAGNTEKQADLGEIRLAAMDAAGITMQIIANSSYQEIEDAATAVNLVKKNNDHLAEIIARRPDRFAGFAALPTQDPKAAADEFERAVKQLGFKGAMIEGQDHANWEFLDSQKFRGLWERAAALEAPIYLHPNSPPPGTFKLIDGHPELQSMKWAGCVYSATQALRIIGSGVFDAFPKAQLILGHLGELLPYWLGRLDQGRNDWKTTKKPPSAYIRENILISTSGLYYPEALICAINAVGADRILFATDYAEGDSKLAVEFFEKTPMSEADREKIYHVNAERWLRI